MRTLVDPAPELLSQISDAFHKVMRNLGGSLVFRVMSPRSPFPRELLSPTGIE
jgi:hypothetical protein